MSIVVVAAGIVSALGTGVARVSSAWRGGVSGLHEHPYALSLQGTPPIVAAALPIRRWPDTTRWSGLITSALTDSRAQLDARILQRPVRVVLTLPSPRPGCGESLVQHAVDTMAQCLAVVSARVSGVEVLRDDECGAAAALSLAESHLSTDEACLVLSVDSWLDPDAMEWLDSMRQLHGGGHRRATLWGRVPGEAAAALWIVRRESFDAQGDTRALHVHGVGLAHEPHRPECEHVIDGRALHSAVAASLAPLSASGESAGVLLTDSGAAPWRAEEWGLAALRCRSGIAADHEVITPANRWGDVGAASGAAALALLSDLLRQRAWAGRNALIISMAASGGRAGMVVSSHASSRSIGVGNADTGFVRESSHHLRSSAA